MTTSNAVARNAVAPSAFRLALFWLGIQAVWGALLGISLQSRIVELAPGAPLVAYGRIAAAGALLAAFVQLAAGAWSDARRRNGSRRLEFYGAGAVVSAGAIVWFYGAGTLLTLACAYFLVQLAMNVAIGPYQAIVPDLVARDRYGAASSWMAAFQSVGNAIGAVWASVVAQGLAAGIGLAALLLASWAGTATHVARLALEPPPAAERIRLSRPFVDLFISRALVYVGFFTLLGYLFFYVQATLHAPSLAAARLQSGLLILIFTAVGAAGAAVAARPSDRMDKRLVATIGGLAFVAALLGFVASGTLALAAAATVVAGVGWGVFLVADWAIACRILPPGALATSMGIWNLALIVPQIVAPALTTWVLTRFAMAASTPAGPRLAFVLAAGETILGIAWLWRLSRCAIGE